MKSRKGREASSRAEICWLYPFFFNQGHSSSAKQPTGLRGGWLLVMMTATAKMGLESNKNGCGGGDEDSGDLKKCVEGNKQSIEGREEGGFWVFIVCGYW